MAAQIISYVSQRLAQALVSFAVTGTVKAKTMLNGSPWLKAVNLGVSLLSSLCVLWFTGASDALAAALAVSLDTAISALFAWATHKLVKPGYVD
ncbi:MAG: hypothetical protein PHT59_04080 [Candidatus Omnitrophica bacterium]|nr:hypothetical protein [Candidatus Omnitrophota bacterium]